MLVQISTPFRWLVPGLATIASLPAFAFGLGELTVSSSLGQPLDARISLLGEARELNADCFRLGAVEGTSMLLPGDIRLKLEQSPESASLRIQTRQAINDPALMFSVSTVCPERIQRDYAVLLDPPALPREVPVVGDSPTGQAGSHPSNDPGEPVAKPKRPKALVATAATSTRKNKAASRRSQKHPAEARDKGPRLILSGSRRAYSQATAQLSLNMDVSLPDLNRRLETPLTPAELTDENTALSHKIVHLEQLLAALQKRNAELEQARARTTQAPPAGKPSGGTNWPYYLLGLALFTGGTAYVLYRRRFQQGEREPYRPTASPAPFSSSLSMQPVELETAQAPGFKAPHTGHASLQKDTATIASLASQPKEGTEVKDSVADEVEVFVAHGHADLAIHMLEDHINRAPDESPVPWLLLLDLLKREGAEGKYESYRQKCKLHFNVAIPAYGEAEVTPGSQGLESYPHIMSELIRLWPTNQVNTYLDDLIYDRRGGSRMGFDPVTYRDIVMLRALRTASA